MYITIDKQDANTILLQYSEITPDVGFLFDAAKQVDDSHLNEIQFNFDLNKEAAIWCQSMINDNNDESGIFSHYLDTYNEKTTTINEDVL